MGMDFDNLIRNAKPAVPATARERVLEYVEAGGAAASTPAPVRLLLRVAACAVLALASGVAAALLSQPERADVVVDFNAQVDQLRERVDALEANDPASRVSELEQQVAALESERNSAMSSLVNAVVDARETRRMEEWRERHIKHMREHSEREVEATIERLRKDAGLSADQEVEVRALLEEAAKEAEGLVGNFYGKGRRGHHSAHSEFEKLAERTDEKLTALLSEQQRDKVGAGLVSNRPEDWGPSSEFRDGTDVDVYMNWMTVSRE